MQDPNTYWDLYRQAQEGTVVVPESITETIRNDYLRAIDTQLGPLLTLRNALTGQEKEHEYVKCHTAGNELGVLDKEQIVSQLVSVMRNNIMELEERNDLESRNNDSDDFFTTSIWSLKAALVEAYNLGREQALAQSKVRTSLDDIIKSADIRVAGPKDALDTAEKKLDIER